MNQDDPDCSLKSDISGRTSSEEGLLLINAFSSISAWTLIRLLSVKQTLLKLERALNKGNRQDVAIIEEMMDGEIFIYYLNNRASFYSKRNSLKAL